MEKEVKDFLEKIHQEHDSYIDFFIGNFSEEKYDLISKITFAPDTLTKQEHELLATKYNNDAVISDAIIKSKLASNYLKNEVIKNYIKAAQEKQAYIYDSFFATTILKYYKDISNDQLKSLFHYFHEQIFNRAINVFQNPIEYEEKIINGLTKLELAVLSEKITEPENYKPKWLCFQWIESPDMHQYIINHLPENAEIAEKVVTALINNPTIDDKTKDELYEQYGCLTDKLLYTTPKMADELYRSAMDSYELLNDKTRNSDVATVNDISCFIEKMMNSKSLTEAMQYDAVARMINRAKTLHTTAKNEVVEYIAKNTDSDRILNFIIKHSKNKAEKKAAYKNENASKEIQQDYAHTFCNKIKRGAKSYSSSWENELIDIMSKVALRQEDYDILVDFGNWFLYNAMCSTSTTPSNVIDTIEHKTGEILKEKDKGHFKYPNIFAKMNILMKNQGHNSTLELDTATAVLDATIKEFTIENTLIKFPSCIQIPYGQEETIKDIVNNIKKIVENVNWEFPDGGDIKTFENELDKWYIRTMQQREKEQQIELKEEELPYYKLAIKKKEIIRDFHILTINFGNSEPYIKLKEFTDNYNRLDKMCQQKWLEENKEKEGDER